MNEKITKKNWEECELRALIVEVVENRERMERLEVVENRERMERHLDMMKGLESYRSDKPSFGIGELIVAELIALSGIGAGTVLYLLMVGIKLLVRCGT